MPQSGCKESFECIGDKNGGDRARENQDNCEGLESVSGGDHAQGTDPIGKDKRVDKIDQKSLSKQRGQVCAADFMGSLRFGFAQEAGEAKTQEDETSKNAQDALVSGVGEELSQTQITKANTNEVTEGNASRDRKACTKPEAKTGLQQGKQNRPHKKNSGNTKQETFEIQQHDTI